MKNMGVIDKSVRGLAVVLIAVLYFTGTINGTLSLVLGIVAAIFIVTAFVGVCPLYIPLRISTRKKN